MNKGPKKQSNMPFIFRSMGSRAEFARCSVRTLSFASVRSVLSCAVVLTAFLSFVSCQKDRSSFEELFTLRIAPTITRVTGTNFDAGDQIGLSIRMEDGSDYLSNCAMSYDGSLFSAQDVIWYNDLNECSTLRAYYPYDAAGEPERFAVASDQSGEGFAASDLLASVREEVTPSTSPVDMLFVHLMTKVRIELENQTEGAVTGLQIAGAHLEAETDFTIPAVTVDEAVDTEAVTPKTLTEGTLYEAILVPQTVALTLTVATDDGKEHSRTLASTELLAGRYYTMKLTLTPIELAATLSGEITDWVSGGEIGEAANEEENEEDEDANTTEEVLIYEGEEYAISTLADGRCWMTENLRYNPVAEATLSTGSEGVYYPGENLTDAASVATYGLLYTPAAALGETLTADNVAALEGTQGICPAGWHVPTKAEFETLKASYETFPSEIMPAVGYYWHGTKMEWTESTGKSYLLTSTPVSSTSADKYEVFTGEWVTSTYYGTTFMQKTAPSAFPLRCIKDVE